MELSYEYRIYPNAAQRETIAQTFGCCRFVYNRALALRKEAHDAGGKVPTIFQIDKMLPGWKADHETSWLKEADSMALQQSLRDLDKAYKNFFRAPNKAGFPRFKSKRARQSYRTSKVEVVDACHVKLPKLGIVKARVSRMPEGRILSATVKQVPSGKYFVSLCCTDAPRANPAPAGTAVGVDVGIESLMTLSDGTKVANPNAIRRLERKLAREQRRLSRKKKGSSNRNRQRIRVARVQEKAANVRKDAIHKATSRLANENQVVCLEDLNVRGMLRNRRLSKAAADASFSEVARQLQYKCAMRGGAAVRVGRFYPSSKTCSCCGHALVELPLSARQWQCPECGERHDRDVNAARNILAEGLRLLGGNGTAGHAGTAADAANACGEGVRPTAACAV